MDSGAFSLVIAVGRGGVETLTFRFSEVTITLVAGNLPRSAVPGVCWRLSVVGDVVVNPRALRAVSQPLNAPCVLACSIARRCRTSSRASGQERGDTVGWGYE